MSNLPEVILCDVDGTVALMGKGDPGRRGPYDWDRVGDDDPNQPVIDLVGIFHRAGYPIVFVSGRDEVCREATEAWLYDHYVSHPSSLLFMRRRKDNRPDSEVKAEIYEQQIKGVYSVKYVIDDRDQVVRMWRALGLTVLQVADGNF